MRTAHAHCTCVLRLHIERVRAAPQVAKLLIERQAFATADGPTAESQLLVDSLVTVGRRLGVLNIEKYVAALDLADQVDAIKEVYYRISPDVDQTAFFKHKGWDYERATQGGSPSRR